MDEPFGALDPVTRVEVRREFARIQPQLETTVIIVTHDMAEAFALGRRVGVIDDGQLVVCDTPDARRRDPRDPRVAHVRRNDRSRRRLRAAGARLMRLLQLLAGASGRTARAARAAHRARPRLDRRRRRRRHSGRRPRRAAAARSGGRSWPWPTSRRPFRAWRCWDSCCRSRSSAASDRAPRSSRSRFTRCLPIVRTTVTGIRQVDRAVIEAGVAMGMTPRQLLFLVELPLALPSIVAGVRVATVIGVGTATIAAAIGAGGLGEYIFRGLSMVDTTTILAGAIPAAALALVADGALAWVERRLRRARHRSGAGRSRRGRCRSCSWSSSSGAAYARIGRRRGRRRLEELHRAGDPGRAGRADDSRPKGVRVDRKLNLGGTFVCDRALRTGRSRRLRRIHGHGRHGGVPRDGAARFAARRSSGRASSTRAAASRCSAPLGFNNTFSILVRGRDARALGLRTIDDLRSVAGRWTPGFGYEFLQRDDGYPRAGQGVRADDSAASRARWICPSSTGRWRTGRSTSLRATRRAR